MEIKGLQDNGARGGGIVITAKTHGAILQGQSVHFLMDSSGYLTQNITAAAGMVGVARAAYASGEVGEFVVEGVVYCNMAGTVHAGDDIVPSAAAPTTLTTTSAAFAGVVGQAACVNLGVALESGSGAALVKCLVNGINMTVSA